MWEHCLPLGQFTTSKNTNVDLGVHISPTEISFATVYGNDPGDYMCGPIEYFYNIDKNHVDSHNQEIRQEVFKRLDSLGILKPYLDSKKEFFESRKSQDQSIKDVLDFYEKNGAARRDVIIQK